MAQTFAKLDYSSLLSFLETMTPTQIAGKYGVSANAVDHKIRRAREKFGLPLRCTSARTRPVEQHKVPERTPLTAFHAISEEELVKIAEGKTYREIAEAHDVTLDQVRNRVYRARNKLGIVAAPIPRTQIARPRSPITDDEHARWLRSQTWVVYGPLRQSNC